MSVQYDVGKLRSIGIRMVVVSLLCDCDFYRPLLILTPVKPENEWSNAARPVFIWYQIVGIECAVRVVPNILPAYAACGR